MNKRIAYLTKLVESGKADSFAKYALAMELKKEERIDEALLTFETLLKEDPQYLPQYLICGQMLLDLDRGGEARGWLEAGQKVALAQGDGKAISEIEAALAGCD